jgi:Zinc knuckle
MAKPTRTPTVSQRPQDQDLPTSDSELEQTEHVNKNASPKKTSKKTDTRYSLPAIDEEDDDAPFTMEWFQDEYKHRPELLFRRVLHALHDIEKYELQIDQFNNTEKDYRIDIANLTIQCEDLEKQKTQLEDQKDQLEHLLIRFSQNRQDTPDSTISTSNKSQRSTKLKDPEPLDGKFDNGLTFDNWLTKMKRKMKGNADHFDTEESRLTYVSSLVTGYAYTLIHPRLDPDHPATYQTVNELYEHLFQLFGDPNRKKTARTEFKKLYMKKDEKFQDFHARFLQLSTNAETPAGELKDELNDKLEFTLQAFVATYYNDPNINDVEFARHCLTIDQQIKTRAAKMNRNRPTTTGAGQNRSAAPSNSIAIVPRPAAAPATAPNTSNTSNTPSATRPNDRPRPVYDNPRTQGLSRSGKCFVCESTGHMMRDCPERTKVAEIDKGQAEPAGNVSL